MTSGIIKSNKHEDDYFLNEVEVITNKKEDAVLIGRIIKRTTLEIYSDLNEKGDLIEKDERYSSAPYS